MVSGLGVACPITQMASQKSWGDFATISPRCWFCCIGPAHWVPFPVSLPAEPAGLSCLHKQALGGHTLAGHALLKIFPWCSSFGCFGACYDVPSLASNEVAVCA